jgi:RNA polymerase sigma factor (sigma-70 family)
MTEKQRIRPLTEFFRKEYRAMVGYVRSRIDDTADRDSEDIVQDVMAAILSAADVTGPANNLAAYCYQALRNRVVDMLRRRRKQASLDAPIGDVDHEEERTLLDVIADVKHDPGEAVESRQEHRNIMAAIDELPDDQRAVVIATEVEGRSFNELAESWDVPIGTLLARKSRAIEKIRAKLHTLDRVAAQA